MHTQTAGAASVANVWFIRTHWFRCIAGLTTVTDRPTDHATQSVIIGHIYVHGTVMWPNYGRPT